MPSGVSVSATVRSGMWTVASAMRRFAPTKNMRARSTCAHSRSASVWPACSMPAACHASLWIGGVTIPSTTPLLRESHGPLYPGVTRGAGVSVDAAVRGQGQQLLVGEQDRRLVRDHAVHDRRRGSAQAVGLARPHAGIPDEDEARLVGQVLRQADAEFPARSRRGLRGGRQASAMPRGSRIPGPGPGGCRVVRNTTTPPPAHADHDHGRTPTPTTRLRPRAPAHRPPPTEARPRNRPWKPAVAALCSRTMAVQQHVEREQRQRRPQQPAHQRRALFTLAPGQGVDELRDSPPDAGPMSASSAAWSPAGTGCMLRGATR